jgi:hypothetical protein
MSIWCYILSNLSHLKHNMKFVGSVTSVLQSAVVQKQLKQKIIHIGCKNDFWIFTIVLKSHLSPVSFYWCHIIWDLKKSHYESHASDPISWIFNDIINMGCDLFRPIELFVAK